MTEESKAEICHWNSLIWGSHAIMMCIPVSLHMCAHVSLLLVSCSAVSTEKAWAFFLWFDLRVLLSPERWQRSGVKCALLVCHLLISDKTNKAFLFLHFTESQGYEQPAERPRATIKPVWQTVFTKSRVRFIFQVLGVSGGGGIRWRIYTGDEHFSCDVLTESPFCAVRPACGVQVLELTVPLVYGCHILLEVKLLSTIRKLKLHLFNFWLFTFTIKYMMGPCLD